MDMKWRNYYHPGYFSQATRFEIDNHSDAIKQILTGRSFAILLRQHHKKEITLVTLRETLSGILTNLWSDYLEFQVDERTYYIPLKSILYFYK